MPVCFDDMPNEILTDILALAMKAATPDLELSLTLRLWCDMACVCHRWRENMARQPIAAEVPTSKFPRFCRWAGSSGWRPPLCSIHMDWEQGLPPLFQRRRAQLTRLLHNPAFQQRSGNTLQYLCSAAGVDFDGIDPGVYPNLLSLWLQGPLPDTTLLPPSLTGISIRSSEATQDSAEEQLRLLTQQRTHGALSQLGPQLLHCPRLVCVTLSHYHVDGLAQLLPSSVHRLGVLYCSITLQPADASHDGWLARSLAARAVHVSGSALCGEGVGLIDGFKSEDRLLASAPQ